jgi:hypothetical protein
MTRETGPRRHPAGKISQIPVPDMPPPVPAFETRQLPDPVRIRAIALTAAVDVYPYVKRFLVEELGIPPDDYGAEILDLARTFERYLIGEEADDPTHPS